ncbi:hypothetical protein UCRNP2_4674 [Neofusicoccum parvum UCRNP2]|uniref:Uncharacterized protein n=1 Tax=Botryosphaeria parva (strain UCR-NP2) TaxID=1287680 RepID=R1GAJ5_BOTPV|nr:hypothetical protein UCRNP2_4674 [Neofusicoccum parvum UCRNP2]
MVDCDAHPNNSACEKPVSDVLKTAVPVSIFAVIFLTAGIVFWVIMRKRRQQERIAEEKARQKYRDLGFDDDEPQRRGKNSTRPPPNNNRQSMGPGSEANYHANPNAYLRDNGSSFALSQLHPSLDGQQKPAVQKEFV